MFNFGAGRAYITSAGQQYELGVVQSASLELKVDMKELRDSANRYPKAVADGKGSASGKISFMQLWPEVLSQVLANGSGLTNGGNTGNIQAIIGEQGFVTTAAGPVYQYVLAGPTTPTPFVTGSEVVQVTVNGTPFYYTRTTAGNEKSASNVGNASGLYSIANSSGTITLTFIAADGGGVTVGAQGNALSISYLISMGTGGAGTGKNDYGVQIGKMPMNSALTFSLLLIGTGKNIYNNSAQQFLVQLNACLAPSLKFNFKLDDFTDLELDYMAFIDGNAVLGNFFLVNP